MSRFFVVFLLFSALFLTSCDNQKAGTFAVNFSWAKDDAGNSVKPDIDSGEFFVTVRIYEWKDGVTFPGDIAANGKQLTQSDSAQMKATGTSIDFGDISYGERRFVVAEIRKGEELTNSVLFTGMSQLFDFKAGKHTEVNVEMKLTPTPGVDEEGNRIDAELRIVDDNGNLRSYTSGTDLKVKLRLLNAVSFTHVYFANKEENIKTANGKSYKIGELKKIDDVENGYELDGEWDLSFGLTADEIAVLPELKVYARLENEYGTGLLVMAKIALDNQSPELTLGLNPAYTNGSKTITLNISSNELIKHDTLNIKTSNPKLLFDCPAPTKNESLSFTCEIETLDAVLKDGDYTITVSATDQAGNVSEEGKTTLTIDRESPELTFIAYKNGTETTDTIYLKENDEFKVDLTLSKEPAETPVVRLGSAGINCTKTADLKYSCIAEIKEDTYSEGISDLSVNYQDMAENQFSGIIVSGIRLDYIVPVLTFKKSKDSTYNATDQILLTVSANEELSEVKINGTDFSAGETSWSIAGSNVTGTHEVKASAIDKAGNVFEEKVIGSYEVDAVVPGLITGTIDRTKAGLNITYTVDFEITKPVKDEIPVVKANNITLDNCSKNGSDTIFRCTRKVLEETDATVYAVTAVLEDAAGNKNTVTIGTILIDKTLPSVIAGTANLNIDAGNDCQLPQQNITTLATGSTGYVSVQVSEVMEDGFTPELRAKKTGAGDIVFDYAYNIGLMYYFEYEHAVATPDESMIGEYELSISLKDEAGNESDPTFNPDKPFKIGRNNPVLVINQNAVSYNRSPWGRPTPNELKDGGGALKYTIPANDYYELGPNDFYEATDQLPAGTFTLDYGVETNVPIQLKAWDKGGTELRMNNSTPNSDGSFPRGRIWSYNSPEISLSAIDSSCIETGKINILNNTWIATMNKKEPRDYYKNPHEFLSKGFIEPQLEQGLEYLNEPLNGGIFLQTQKGKEKGWSQLRDGEKPSVRNRHTMAYDSARGKVVLFGGQTATSTYNDETWEWDGTNWTLANPATKPSGRSQHAMTYDSARGKTVLFGGYGGAYLDETWEWDGTNWTLLNPTVNPSPRYSHAMTYDSTRGKVVLFGGYTSTSPYRNDETWEWDGTNWTLANPTTKPSARELHTMAFDSARSKVVMFGGNINYNDETWEWDGENWTLLTPTVKPSPRYNHAMAYDSARGKVVIFGGLTDSGYSNETWKWDGENWTLVNTATKPSARSYHAMAYDSAHGKVAIFGGNHSGDETWEWNGENWTLINPATKPSGTTYAMAYDSARSKVVMFGGNNYNNETWEWDGTNWTLANPATKPSGRSHHAMAFDSTRGKVVLFGGSTANYTYNDETWEWDGTNWTLVNPATKPSARQWHAMAFDSVCSKVVMFGGQTATSTYNDETWEWDGTNWTLANPATKPSARQWHAMAFDSNRGKIVLFGGFSTYNNETWEWDGENWTLANPTTKPSARALHAMAFDSGRGKIVLFGGLKSSVDNDETWEWDGGGNNQTTQIMSVAWQSSGITDDSQIQSLSVLFNAGGLGDFSGTPHEGVDLLTWKHDRWATVSFNEAGLDSLEPVTWETTDPVEIQTLLNSGLRKFNFAVVPTAPNGFLTDMGSIATDYAEVVVRYRISE